MPSITQYSRIFICPLFCKPMIYPSHRSRSLVLQAKYRRNCILNPIALSTDQLCYFKPTVSSRCLVLFYTSLGDDVRLRIHRVKLMRKRIHPVDSSVSPIISVRSGSYRFGIQQAHQKAQASRVSFCSMGNLFCDERRIVDNPRLFSSAYRPFYHKEIPPGVSPKEKGGRVGNRFRPLVHFIQKVSRHFMRLFLSRTSSEVAFLSDWIATHTTKIRNTLALLFVPSHFLKTHDFAN
jgi:hypothetical protein